MSIAMSKVKFFALSQYLDAVMKIAEYDRDEDGVSPHLSVG